MNKLFFFLLVLVLVPAIVEAAGTVEYSSPSNTTIQNRTITITTTSNETINKWYYELDDSGINVTFTPSVDINVTNDVHKLRVWVNSTDSNQWNYSDIYFTAAYINITCWDEETGGNCGAGVTIRIRNSSTDALIQQSNTDENGTVYHTALAYATYKIQSGLSGTDYPYLRKKTVVFNTANTDVKQKLVKSATGGYVTYQVVDSYYATPIDGVSATWYTPDGTEVLDEQSTDSNGYITEYIRVGQSYLTEFVKTDYQNQNVSKALVLSLYSVKLVRSTLLYVPSQDIYLFTYPDTNYFYENGTAHFSLDIYASNSDLSEYGIVIGYDPDVIRDSTYPFDSTMKIKKVTGNTAQGGFISTDGIDLNNWNSDKIYAGYYYNRTGNETKWVVREFNIVGLPDENQYFYDIRLAVQTLYIGMGYTSWLAIQLSFLFLVGYVSFLASNFGSGAFGVLAYLFIMGFFVALGFLSQWMIPFSIFIMLGIIRYRGGIGGQEV